MLSQLTEEQYRKSALYIKENELRIEKTWTKKPAGSRILTNNTLRAQLEEQIELTLCTNKQAEIELIRRKQSDTALPEIQKIYKAYPATTHDSKNDSPATTGKNLKKP